MTQPPAAVPGTAIQPPRPKSDSPPRPRIDPWDDPRASLAANALRALMTPNTQITPEWPLAGAAPDAAADISSHIPSYRARAYWPLPVSGEQLLYPMLEMFFGGAVLPCDSRIFFKRDEPILGRAWASLSNDDDDRRPSPVSMTKPMRTQRTCGSNALWREALVDDGTPARIAQEAGYASGYSAHVALLACVAFPTAFGPLVISVETIREDGFGDTGAEQQRFLGQKLIDVAGTRIVGQVDFWTWVVTRVRSLFWLGVAGGVIEGVGSFVLGRAAPQVVRWFNTVGSAGRPSRAPAVDPSRFVADCVAATTAVRTLLTHHAATLGHRGDLALVEMDSLCTEASAAARARDVIYFVLHGLMLLLLLFFRPTPADVLTPQPFDAPARDAAKQVSLLVKYWREATNLFCALYLILAFAAGLRDTPTGPWLMGAASALNLYSTGRLLRVYFCLTRSIGRKFEGVPDAANVVENGLYGLTFLAVMSHLAGASEAAHGLATWSAGLIGLYSGVVLGLLVGRLNSPILGTPGIVIACLYIYVVMQPLYPFLLDPGYVLPLNLTAAALKILLFLVMMWVVSGNAAFRYLLFTGQPERPAPRVTGRVAWKGFRPPKPEPKGAAASD